MDTTEHCINHLDRDAQYSWNQCGAAICYDCMEITKGHYVCQACDKKLAEWTQPPSAEKPYYAKQRRWQFMNPRSLLEGAIYGLVVGLIGAIIWERIAYMLQVQIGLINVAIGLLVGVCVVGGAERGGFVPAFVSGLLMSGSMLVGHFLLANDLLTTYAFAHHIAKPPLTFPLFTGFMRQMSLIQWLYVAAGVVVSVVLPWTYAKWRIV